MTDFASPNHFYVTIVKDGSEPGSTSPGAVIFSTVQPNADISWATAAPLLETAAVLYVRNFAGTQSSRVFGLRDDTDGVAPLPGSVQETLVGTVPRLSVFNGTNWDRVRSAVDNADGIAVGSTGLLGVVGRPQLFNGTNWDRQRSAQAVGDGAVGSGYALAAPALFNGATWDRARSLPDNVDTAQGTLGLSGVVARLTAINGGGGSTYSRLTSQVGSIDSLTAADFLLQVSSRNVLFNGTLWDRQRTPIVFKTATATPLGNTAVWTPAAGKKFRLMGYSIELTNNGSLAAAGLLELTLNDSGTAIGQGRSVFVPNAAGATLGSSVGTMVLLGNGYLSTTANNVLNINLSVALATGEVRVIAFGTEE